MVGEAEWQWVAESVVGDWNHVVLASSLPLLLPYGIHGLEAWNEAVCGGAWGQRLARTGERIRQELDLEHWAAFGRSFGQFEELLTGLATGTYGRPPASVTVLGGDIHHSYLAAVDFPRGTNPGSSVYQAVCSPIHNVLPDQFRRGQQLITSRPGGMVGTGIARLAGVRKPRIQWRITRGSWFHNMLSALEFDGRRARIHFDRTDEADPASRTCSPSAKPSSADRGHTYDRGVDAASPAVRPRTDVRAAFRHSRTTRARSSSMNAASTSVQRHERGIHAVPQARPVGDQGSPVARAHREHTGVGSEASAMPSAPISHWSGRPDAVTAGQRFPTARYPTGRSGARRRGPRFRPGPRPRAAAAAAARRAAGPRAGRPRPPARR